MTQQKMKQRQFIKVFTWNDYTDSLGPAGADYPWVSEGGYAAVVEPHKEHHFRACALKRTQQGRMGESQCVSDMTLFSWSVDGVQTSSLMGGGVFTHVFTTLGPHAVVAMETKSDEGSDLPDEEGASSQGVAVVCKYVRRELRELSVADREAFLDAAAVLWRVGATEGAHLYGDHYAPIATFVATHARLAGDACCDHMHDGCGFVTQHSALSLSFEASLQAVDASVALPYWDYSIDVERVARDHDGDFGAFVDAASNELWTSTWFGAVGNYKHLGSSKHKIAETPGNASGKAYVVADGRWAYTPTLKAGDGETRNSYGYLRAPWNNNPVQFLTRSSTMCGATHEEYQFDYWQYPTCDVMWALESEKRSLKDFLRVAPYSPHGSIHALIGGTFECGGEFDRLEATLGLNATTANRFRSVVFNGLKDMFRSGYLEMPRDCAPETSFKDCAASCKNLDTYIAENNTAMLEEYLGLVDFWGLLSDRSFDDRVTALSLICGAGLNVLGDQLEASSPNDISFWPIHPTVDRLFQWKVIAGTLSDMDWPETEYYWGTYGSNVDNVTGHAADDVLEYDLPQLGLKAGEYTNADFLNMSSPLYDTMPYVYAHFKWDHCAELGYAIGNKTALQVAAGDEQYVAPPGDSSAVAGVTLARR